MILGIRIQTTFEHSLMITPVAILTVVKIMHSIYNGNPFMAVFHKMLRSFICPAIVIDQNPVMPAVTDITVNQNGRLADISVKFGILMRADQNNTVDVFTKEAFENSSSSASLPFVEITIVKSHPYWLPLPFRQSQPYRKDSEYLEQQRRAYWSSS